MKKIGLILLSIMMIAGLAFVGCGDDSSSSTSTNVTITFNPNGGELDGSATLTIAKGATIAEEDAPEVSRDGFEFSGWNRTMGGTGAWLEFDITTHDANATYFAIWETVTITFIATPGVFISGAEAGFNTREMIIAKDGKFTFATIPSDVDLEDMDLEGWYTEENGEGTKLTVDIEHDDDATYYANWIPEPTVKVLYCLSTDPLIEDLEGTGGTRENHYIRGNGNPETEMTVDMDNRTLLSSKRGGSSHGIQMHLPLFNAMTKPGRYYRIEYGGEIIKIADNTTTANYARLRLESGTNPSLANPVGIPAATSNYLAVSGNVNPTVGNGEAFNIIWTVTAEELATMSGSSTTISFGDERHTGAYPDGARRYDIKYTTVRITQIRLEEGECIVCDTLFTSNSCTCNTAITTAKSKIESATFAERSIVVNSMATANTAARAAINALGMDGVVVEVVDGTFAAASAGGPGTYTFSVNLSRGIGTPVTVTNLSMSIKFMPPYVLPTLPNGETLIFDMQLPEYVTQYGLTRLIRSGSTPSADAGDLFTVSTVTIGGNLTSDPKFLAITGGRSGTGQSIRLNLTRFNTLTKPNHSYRIEYEGTLIWSRGTTTGNVGRLRLESGTNPSATNPVGTPAATGAVLALSAAPNADRNFKVVWTATAAEFAGMTTATANASQISFGDNVGDGSNTDFIEYSVIRIVQICPADCEVCEEE